MSLPSPPPENRKRKRSVEHQPTAASHKQLKIATSTAINNTNSNNNNLGQLCWACFSKSEAALRILLLKGGLDPNAAHGQDQSTPLHVAATVGFLNGVDQLLQHPEVDVNKVDAHGNTAIHRAILGNNTSCLQLLLENGSRVDIQDKNGRLPIHLAALYRRSDCVSLLLSFADHDDLMDKRTIANRTVVEECLVGGSASILKMLLKHILPSSRCHHHDQKESNNNNNNNHGWIGTAVYWNRIECLKVLIEAGLDVNTPLSTQDPSDTALHRAVQQRKIDMVRCLCAAKAKACLPDGSNPPLLYAASHGFVDMIRLLITPDTSADTIRQAYLLMDTLGLADRFVNIVRARPSSSSTSSLSSPSF
ncbi:hypothetical protein O0I10_001443 [Lichtheimia ornata]|uniref:Uncharacterized protein n=1 Tax=Lichtheimia ornata TaxID=688661 RepID=A0AAD7Y2D1_9FUNG|nr:uncharacterized protein O0I10_001443 [Lichtheimia ornata]KAJ8662483.1 hypothetical protein O0I10_001443 [Lichtheimia ornata]